MKQTQYPEDFLTLWDTFSSQYGNKGSKKVAYASYVRLEVDEADLLMLVNSVINQQHDIDAKRMDTGWSADFRHVSTWLNQEGWEDERYQSVNQLPRSDQRKASDIERYQSRHMAESVDEIERGPVTLVRAK